MAPYKRRVGKKKVTKAKRSKKTYTNVKRLVRREIARNIEDKTIQYYNTGANILPSSSAGFNATIIPISPFSSYLQINQGTNQQSRIGNRIKVKSLRFRGTIYPLPFDASTNPTPYPMHIKMWLFYDRQTPNTAPGAVGTTFLQEGSTSRGLFNDLVDLHAMVNTDRYKIFHTRAYKLGFAQNQWNATGGDIAATDIFQYGTTNDFKYNAEFNIDCTKYVPKNIIYNDNDSQPTSRGLYCMITALNANGDPIPASVIPAQYQYMLSIKYEDA